MTRGFAPAAVIAAFAILTAGVAATSTIFSPDQVIRNDFGEFGATTVVTRLIDGAGMSVGFTSGVTDCDTYAAGGPTYGSNNGGGHFFGQRDALAPGVVDFDFGQTLTIDRIWLFNNPARGILSLEIYTSTVSDFSVSAMVGSFSLGVSNSATAMTPLDTLDVVDSSAQCIRFNILSYETVMLGIGEVFARRRSAASHLGRLAARGRRAARRPAPPRAGLSGGGGD
jgi:hypothetical protein